MVETCDAFHILGKRRALFIHSIYMRVSSSTQCHGYDISRTKSLTLMWNLSIVSPSKENERPALICQFSLNKMLPKYCYLFCSQFCIPFQMFLLVLLCMVALKTSIIWPTDLLLENFHQNSGFLSYHSEKNSAPCERA